MTPRLLLLEDCVVDLDAATVSRWNQTATLSPIETRLLTYISERPTQVIDANELLREVWG